jgi:hypothetical protein
VGGSDGKLRKRADDMNDRFTETPFTRQFKEDAAKLRRRIDQLSERLEAIKSKSGGTLDLGDDGRAQHRERVDR